MAVSTHHPPATEPVRVQLQITSIESLMGVKLALIKALQFVAISPTPIATARDRDTVFYLAQLLEDLEQAVEVAV
ncbi:MAG: hypothetical protein IPI59_15550 [Sphingobacteriales bacterium]|jgi:hypothetical protein|nr:hypothetical protein [Sphingobacteriales bacterium]MBP9141684.1 hypothetical protein [Chitinophagales bacterium]MDA0198480.1 hypothetical protein [Bacteroidota bacterium]MBK6888581.1 hypothetical protein [Sphingobacteriales bacterium]MBK7528911.1 hypothetical protein [Sphingobacteriales bacterium]